MVSSYVTLLFLACHLFLILIVTDRKPKVDKDPMPISLHFAIISTCGIVRRKVLQSKNDILQASLLNSLQYETLFSTVALRKEETNKVHPYNSDNI